MVKFNYFLADRLVYSSSQDILKQAKLSWNLLGWVVQFFTSHYINLVNIYKYFVIFLLFFRLVFTFREWLLCLIVHMKTELYFFVLFCTFLYFLYFFALFCTFCTFLYFFCTFLYFFPQSYRVNIVREFKTNKNKKSYFLWGGGAKCGNNFTLRSNLAFSKSRK